MSQVKSFANELFFDIFEFSNTVLHSSRFNQLIYAHFQNHQFNLQSIAKEHFDIIMFCFVASAHMAEETRGAGRAGKKRKREI